MFDSEVLHNRVLIEEREEYENSFISVEDIIKSDEMDFQIKNYMYLEEKFEIGQFYLDDFDFEEYMLELHYEQLIEERLSYEKEALLDIDDYPDYFDNLIESHDFGYDYDDWDYNQVPEYYDYELEEDYVEEISMDAAYCGNAIYGYVVEDDVFDSFCEYDYPEDPCENICGIICPEPVYYDSPFMDFPDEDYYCPEPDYHIEILDANDSEEQHLQELIRQHLLEEKEFLDYEFPDEVYFPQWAKDLIFF